MTPSQRAASVLVETAHVRLCLRMLVGRAFSVASGACPARIGIRPPPADAAGVQVAFDVAALFVALADGATPGAYTVDVEALR